MVTKNLDVYRNEPLNFNIYSFLSYIGLRCVLEDPCKLMQAINIILYFVFLNAISSWIIFTLYRVIGRSRDSVTKVGYE